MKKLLAILSIFSFISCSLDPPNPPVDERLSGRWNASVQKIYSGGINAQDLGEYVFSGYRSGNKYAGWSTLSWYDTWGRFQQERDDHTRTFFDIEVNQEKTKIRFLYDTSSSEWMDYSFINNDSGSFLRISDSCFGEYRKQNDPPANTTPLPPGGGFIPAAISEPR